MDLNNKMIRRRLKETCNFLFLVLICDSVIVIGKFNFSLISIVVEKKLTDFLLLKCSHFKE